MEEPATPSPDQEPTRPKRSVTTRWALAAAVILAIVAFYALGLHRYFSWDSIRANLTGWESEVRANLFLAIVIYFVIYVTTTALSLPAASFISLVGGALFGRWLGTAVVSVAATIGATLAFLGSRYLLRDVVQARFGARLAAINRGIEKDGAFYLFTLRLVPAVPFFLINLGMGLTPMRVSTYAGVSWIGMLPGTFLYVNAGTALGKLLTEDSPRGLLSPEIVISLAVLGLAPLLIRKLVQWKNRRAGVVSPPVPNPAPGD